MKKMDDYTKYVYAKRIIQSCNSWDTVGLNMRYWIDRLFKTDSDYHWLLHDHLTDRILMLKNKLYQEKLRYEMFK